MKRVSPIRSFTSILVIFFLLASIVCSSNDSLGANTYTQEFVATKKPNTPSKSDTQLPEKVEAENDCKPHNTFFFIHLIGEYLRFNITKSQSACLYTTFRLRGSSMGIPLYLIKRSILI